MDMSLKGVDSFEPLWARAAALAGFFVAIIAITLLMIAFVKRRNPVGRRVYLILGLLLVTGVCSSTLYHVAVRLPSGTAYEHENPKSYPVRRAANREFYRLLGLQVSPASFLEVQLRSHALSPLR